MFQNVTQEQVEEKLNAMSEKHPGLTKLMVYIALFAVSPIRTAKLFAAAMVKAWRMGVKLGRVGLKPSEIVRTMDAWYPDWWEKEVDKQYATAWWNK